MVFRARQASDAMITIPHSVMMHPHKRELRAAGEHEQAHHADLPDGEVGPNRSHIFLTPCNDDSFAAQP